MTGPQTAAWGPCPPGELTRLSAWLALRRRLATAAMVGWVALAAAAAAGLGWGTYAALSGPSETPVKHPRTRSSAPGRESGAFQNDVKGVRITPGNTGTKK